MFQHSRLRELKLMYDIFHRNTNNNNKKNKEIITLKMQPYIISRGEAITKDENLLKDPLEFS